jgi:hypothetical protein
VSTGEPRPWAFSTQRDPTCGTRVRASKTDASSCAGLGRGSCLMALLPRRHNVAALLVPSGLAARRNVRRKKRPGWRCRSTRAALAPQRKGFIARTRHPPRPRHPRGVPVVCSCGRLCAAALAESASSEPGHVVEGHGDRSAPGWASSGAGELARLLPRASEGEQARAENSGIATRPGYLRQLPSRTGAIGTLHDVLPPPARGRHSGASACLDGVAPPGECFQCWGARARGRCRARGSAPPPNDFGTPKGIQTRRLRGA